MGLCRKGTVPSRLERRLGMYRAVCKQEDLSPSSRPPAIMIKPGMVMCTWNLGAGEAEAGGSLELTDELVSKVLIQRVTLEKKR